MLSATIYTFETALSDVDRGVYETFSLRLARHPSETLEFMLTRFLAYCLEYTEGITMTDGGISSGDEPAVMVRDLTGRVAAWIEVGLPDAAKLHRGSKLASRAAVYTHRHIGKVLEALGGRGIHRAGVIPVYEFGPAFVDRVAPLLERREQITLSVTSGHLYLDISGRSFESRLGEHHFA